MYPRVQRQGARGHVKELGTHRAARCPTPRHNALTSFFSSGGYCAAFAQSRQGSFLCFCLRWLGNTSCTQSFGREDGETERVTRNGENEASFGIAYECRTEFCSAGRKDGWRRGWPWKHHLCAASEAYLIKDSKTVQPLKYHSKIVSDGCPLTAAPPKALHVNVLFGLFPLPSQSLRARSHPHGTHKPRRMATSALSPELCTCKERR